MIIKPRKILLITVLLPIFILFASIASAENLEEIMEAQKELKTIANEDKNKRHAESKRLVETKDAIKMGKNEYQRTCSLCHGIDAKGHGIYAFELNKAPANLALIKKSNNNAFPFSKLYRIIDGRDEITSHGTRMMPIWGQRFNSESWINTNQLNSETLVRGRIFELLLYLETIQE
jgi:mono/diheme cytochrome c family protein